MREGLHLEIYNKCLFSHYFDYSNAGTLVSNSLYLLNSDTWIFFSHTTAKPALF